MPPPNHPSYNWPRFWCPRDGYIQLDEDGLLVDPESDLAETLSLQLPRLEALAGASCLALLGEPGTGKSHEVGRIYTASRSAANHGTTLFVDLRAYDSTSELRRDLFDSTHFREWVEGSGPLTLYFDSLDEALLEITPLSAWLLGQLHEQPTERLRVRFACRTADWPPFLEAQLRMIWGDDRCGVYEIAPLRYRDVREAAAVRGLNPEAFTTEMRRKKAGALASKPVTLNFLLNLFASQGRFPASQAELYRKGCRQLCEEQNPERRASRRTGRFPASQRLAAASRIAAVTVFGNRSAVWTEVDSGNVPSSDVTRADLSGGTEVLGGDSVNVDEDLLQEALGTGLFSSRGEHRLGWAHQTYAEFLAALWVAEHRMPLPQIEALIRHPGDPGGRIIPQLAETVAWLSGMDPRVRTLVLDVEPELLLRSDVERATDEERARMVKRLVHRAASGELQRPPFGSQPPYDRLLHPRLDAQLRAFITDRSLPHDARELAIKISRSTESRAVQNELADLALDVTEPIELRVDATLALARIGDSETRRRLLPLATEEQQEDVTDDLKGYALEATWPDHLTAVQLFEVLTPPKRPSFHGGYTGFFYRLAAKAETISPLSTALSWVRAEQWTHGMLRVLPEAILLAAWSHLDEPDVLDAFAEVVIDAMKHHHRLIDWSSEMEDAFVQSVDSDRDKRLALVEAALRLWDDRSEGPDYLAFLLHHWHPQLLRTEDEHGCWSRSCCPMPMMDLSDSGGHTFSLTCLHPGIRTTWRSSTLTVSIPGSHRCSGTGSSRFLWTLRGSKKYGGCAAAPTSCRGGRAD